MFEIKLKKNNLRSFLFVIIYKIVLDFSYYFLISKIWSSQGYLLKLNTLKLIESYFLLFIIFVLMPKSSKKLSNILTWLLILFSYVPVLTVYAMSDQSRFFTYYTTIFWIMIFLLTKVPTLFFPSLNEKQAKIIYYSFFVCLAATVIFLLYKYLGFFLNFDLSKVYNTRSYYISAKVPFGGYLLNWMALILNPMFFAIFLKNRKFIYATLIVFIQLFLFSVTGHKIYLFLLPYLFVLMLIITSKYPLTFTSSVLAIIIILGMFSYFLFGDLWTSALFTNRTLLTPALLSYYHYDFFSNNGLIYLSAHHFFNVFISYPYHLDPSHLIGEVYFNNPNVNANNGIVSDAYMNFGVIGLIIWPILFTIFLKLIDSFSEEKDIRISFAAMGASVIVFTNGAFLTSMLTNGLFIGLILLYLLPKNITENYD